jgi:carbon storage regulator
MLVLSRRIDQKIMIGEDIVITVLKIQHDQVRLGIEAPRNVDVHREEVYQALRQANLAAATSEGSAGGLERLRSLAPAPHVPGQGPTGTPGDAAH